MSSSYKNGRKAGLAESSTQRNSACVVSEYGEGHRPSFGAKVARLRGRAAFFEELLRFGAFRGYETL